MIKNWFTTSKIEDTHPSEEDLLKCVDGELSAKDAARVRSHLETCWSCRLILEKIEETISAFVEFRQQIYTPLTQKTPKNWSDFDRKLNELAIATPGSSKSWWSASFGGFGKFFQNSMLVNWSPGLKRTAVSMIAVILIAVIFWQFIIVRTVSANELLDKASQFQMEKIGQVGQPVVYQKLRVLTQNAAEMNWELWRDTTRSRFRQNVSDEGTKKFNQDLWNILQSNGFNPQEPLSAVTFANWRKTLVEKRDTVENEQAQDGKNLLTLRTLNLRADSMGKISEGILKVRADDFHPVEQILRITTVNGIETYNFTELDFQVLSLTSFKPDFFPEPVEPQLTSLTKPLPSPAQPAEANANTATPFAQPELLAEANSNTTVKKIELPKVIASADLEVEVLDLLNQAKADLGEQITVSRETDGLLYVRGIVETTARKSEILKALQAVQNNPAIRLEIKTVDEAVAEQKNTPQPSGTAEVIENQSSETASDNELLTYFKTEQAVRAFGGQMINRSSRAMSRAFALKRLVGQFKPEELRSLSPEARAKWLTLVNLHARAFREETENLRRELQPVFDAPNVNASAVPDVNDIAAVSHAVAVLLDFASTNDRVVRSAFTLSSGNAGFTAIRTAQFWQSLKNAEAIATKLQSVK